MAPTVETVRILSSWAVASFRRAQEYGAQAEPGSAAAVEAVQAERAFGWLCGWLQECIRQRPDEFAAELAVGLDDDLRRMLEPREPGIGEGD